LPVITVLFDGSIKMIESIFWTSFTIVVFRRS
jgi:hypothetical protein